MFFVNSVLLAYDAASLHNRFLSFIKGKKCLHFEGSRDPRRMTVPEEGLIQILGDGGTTYLEGVGSHLVLQCHIPEEESHHPHRCENPRTRTFSFSVT